MPVPSEDHYKTNLRMYLSPNLATRTARGTIVKDHGALLKKVAKLGNKVILDGLGLATGRRLPRYKVTFPSKESDLQYKYHVSRLSKVYMAPSSNVDTRPPYTVISRPSFYTSPEELAPPVRGRQATLREHTWDRDFSLYHALSPEDRMDGARGEGQVCRPLRHFDRPRSAGPQGRSPLERPEARSRPQSAGARGRSSAHYCGGDQESRACVRYLQQSTAEPRMREEAQLIQAIDTYHPSTEHFERVSDFLDLLDEFDSVSRKGFIEEIERHANSASLLRQYCGTE